MSIKNHNKVFILFCFLFAISCGKAAFFEADAEIKNGDWKINDKKDFTVAVDDTLSSYDFYIDLRHTESYPYNNIYLFMTFTLPDGKRIVDSLGYVMQDSENRWIGNQSGSLVTHQVLVKQNRKFPRSGKYVISLYHGMYDDPLKSVTDIGLTIRKREAKN
jgi:gliding motility-associated lipoprotein GldH